MNVGGRTGADDDGVGIGGRDIGGRATRFGGGGGTGAAACFGAPGPGVSGGVVGRSILAVSPESALFARGGRAMRTVSFLGSFASGMRAECAEKNC